jgi:hypothetical protein
MHRSLVTYSMMEDDLMSSTQFRLARALVDGGHCGSSSEALAILDTLDCSDSGSRKEALTNYFGWTNAEFEAIMMLANEDVDTENDSVDLTDDESMNSHDKTSRGEKEVEEEECVGPGECAICERYMKLTRHHLIPKATWARLESKSRLKYLQHSFAHLNMDNPKAIRKTFQSQVIDICRHCHNHIHTTYDNWTLATSYNTLDRLVDDPAIAKFAKWANQQRVSNKIVHSKRRLRKT